VRMRHKIRGGQRHIVPIDKTLILK
jgi:hypothetical protein